MTSPTCLFTGEELGPDTAEEHAIPRAIGGRIRSRVVTSSAFNNTASDVLDIKLVRAYAVVMNALGPLLGSEHLGRGLRVMGAESGRAFRIDPRAGATLRSDVEVLDRHEGGQPSRWIAKNEAAASAFAEQLGLDPTQYEKLGDELIPDDVLHMVDPVHIGSAELEVAALRCILTVLDAVLPSPTFVRNSALDSARALVAESVARRDVVSTDRARLHSLGCTTQADAALVRARKRIAEAPSEFEHIVGVWTTPSRTIEAVWSILGVEAYGFRLAYDWRGGQLSWLTGCGALRGGAPFTPVEAPALAALGPLSRTPYTSVVPKGTDTAACAVYFKDLALARHHGVRRAVDLVERTADDHVWLALRNNARAARSDDATLVDGIRRRLRLLYLRDDGSSPDDAVDLVMSGCAVAPIGIAQLDAAEPDERAPWLVMYRACLSRARETLGLPGAVFLLRSRTEPQGRVA